MKRFLAMLVALMLMGTAALAMPVGSDGGMLKLSCGDGEESVTLDVAEFQLLGMGADGRQLIFADGKYYSLLSIMQMISQEDNDRINAASDLREEELSTLAKGDRSEEVRRFQEALLELGYLEGSADGDFGGKTEQAIMALQEALGLEQTGVADARLQMLAQSMIQPKLVLLDQTAENSPLASVAERAGLDLQALLAAGLKLDYDDITGTGFLSDGSSVSYESPEGADIDAYALALQFGLLLQEQEDGSMSVDPAVKVDCLCVRRPVIEEVIVKAGSNRGSAAIENVTAALNGIKTEESGIAMLGPDMVEALANALEDYASIQAKIHRLSKYYGSDQWMQDYADDEAGKLPRDLKRGVLSEDAVYDLLTENRELLVRMLRLVTAALETDTL